MRFIRILFVIALGVLILNPGIGASQTSKETLAKGAEGKISGAAKPEERYQMARESFLKKEFKASAAAIRREAAYLESLQERAEKGREEYFKASQEGLHILADGVEKGAVKSVEELDRAFGRASQALAQHHYLQAVESWAKKETAKTGQELEAASAYLEGGAKQAEGKVKGEVKSVIEDTRILAGKLNQGAGWVNEEVEKGIKGLGLEIENLGKKVKSSEK